MNKKLIVLTIAWLILVVCVVMILIGCTTSKPNFEPLPPEKLFDGNLLYENELRNIASKSPTIKEIIGEKDFN